MIGNPFFLFLSLFDYKQQALYKHVMCRLTKSLLKKGFPHNVTNSALC